MQLAALRAGARVKRFTDCARTCLAARPSLPWTGALRPREALYPRAPAEGGASPPTREASPRYGRCRSLRKCPASRRLPPGLRAAALRRVRAGRPHPRFAAPPSSAPVCASPRPRMHEPAVCIEGGLAHSFRSAGAAIRPLLSLSDRRQAVTLQRLQSFSGGGGKAKVDSTVRHCGIKIEDALDLAAQMDAKGSATRLQIRPEPAGSERISVHSKADRACPSMIQYAW